MCGSRSPQCLHSSIFCVVRRRTYTSWQVYTVILVLEVGSSGPQNREARFEPGKHQGKPREKTRVRPDCFWLFSP